MPGLDRGASGSQPLGGLREPYLISVIPNILILGRVFLLPGSVSRRIFPVYMASVLLLGGFLIAGTINRKVEHKWIAALVDPFGSNAFGYFTEYWTIFEKNTRIPTGGRIRVVEPGALVGGGVWVGSVHLVEIQIGASSEPGARPAEYKCFT